MKLKPISANMTELEIKNKTILFSYETPVALWDRTIGSYFITEEKHSTTTSKHVSKWLKLHGKEKSQAKIKPQSFFDIATQKK